MIPAKFVEKIKRNIQYLVTLKKCEFLEKVEKCTAG